VILEILRRMLNLFYREKINMFRELEKVYSAIVTLLIISVPLAIWKVIDICVWLYNNVSISLK
jgi:hypothetical protein